MSITQIIRGDSSGAVKAVQDFTKALDKTEEQTKLTKKELKDMDLAARRIAEAADPQKKYNRQLEELAKLVKTGKLELSDAEKQAAKYGRQLEDAGKKGKKTFGQTALSDLMKYAAGIASVRFAIDTVKLAFQEAENAAQSAADNIFASLGQQGEIQQLTDDPKKLASINAFAKDLIRRGIFAPTDRGKAFETAFELESAEFTDADKELFAQVGERGTVKPEGLVDLGGYVRKAQRTFGLPEDTTQEVLDKLIQTSATAQASLVETARAIPEFGSFAKGGGLSFDESLAGFLAVEKRSPGPEEAATRFKNLLKQLRERGYLVDNDLTTSLAGLSQRVEGGESELDLFSEIRAQTGFANLLEGFRTGEIDKFEKIVADSQGLTEKRGGLLEEVDPTYAAAKLRQRAEGSLAAQREDLFSERENLVSAAQAAQRRNLEENYPGVVSGLAYIGHRISDTLGADDFYLRRAASGLAESDPELSKQIRDYLKRTAEGVESINNRRPSPAGRRE